MMIDSVNLAIVTTVSVLAGLLGGVVAYLMNNATVKWRRPEFLKSVLFGILISAAVLAGLDLVCSELFADSREWLVNMILAGCICFLFSVVSLMFLYRFLMRLTSARKKDPPLRIKTGS